MKHTKHLLLAALLFIGGCKKMPESAVTADSTAEVISSEPVLSESENATPSEVFGGLKKTSETAVGNDAAALRSGGYVCGFEGGFLLAEENGILISQNGEETRISAESPSYLNYYEGIIYYLDAKSGKIHTVENGIDSVFSGDISAIYLAVTDRGIFFEDNGGSFYRITDSETVLISDKHPAWQSFYGEWLVFSEFSDNSKIVAYNTESGESMRLLDYGLFPLTAGGSLVYQSSDGNIRRLNLENGEDSGLYPMWGQGFSAVGDALYFSNSAHIYKGDLVGSEPVCVYTADGIENTVDRLSPCGNTLYFYENEQIKSIQPDE